MTLNDAQMTANYSKRHQITGRKTQNPHFQPKNNKLSVFRLLSVSFSVFQSVPVSVI